MSGLEAVLDTFIQIQRIFSVFCCCCFFWVFRFLSFLRRNAALPPQYFVCEVLMRTLIVLRSVRKRWCRYVSGKLTLKIPWKNLYNDAVVATLDGLYLLVVPGASKSPQNPTQTLLIGHTDTFQNKTHVQTDVRSVCVCVFSS